MGRKTKGQNKRIEELKHGVLFMAQKLGTEEKLRKVFDTFEKSIPNAWSLPEREIRTLLFKMAFSQGAVQEIQTAFHYFDKLPKKRPNEMETRQGIISTAQKMGVPKEDVLAIFNKYDNLLKTATSEGERQQISYMGAAEIHRLLQVKGPLIMNGVEIIPAAPDYVEDEKSTFKPVD